MRLSHRVGLAAALIVVGLILIYRMKTVEDGDNAKPFWTFDTEAFRSLLRPAEKNLDSPQRKWRISTDTTAQNIFHTTPIEVPNTKVIVMGKLSEEDTSWVSAELAEWRNFIYTVDDTSVPIHTPKNKGRESLPYLQYIVDHYDDLPETLVFLHSHRDGWPEAWHIETTEYSNVDSVRALQIEYVQMVGYTNLRCAQNPGCPVEIEPFRKPGQGTNSGERYYAGAWEKLFNNTDVPEKVGAPCCSQFAVSRDQVLQRPLSDYQRMYDWVSTNDLEDEVTASIMEFSWHIIFGQEPVSCPNVFECYANVYGEDMIV